MRGSASLPEWKGHGSWKTHIRNCACIGEHEPVNSPHPSFGHPLPILVQRSRCKGWGEGRGEGARFMERHGDAEPASGWMVPGVIRRRARATL